MLVSIGNESLFYIGLIIGMVYCKDKVYMYWIEVMCTYDKQVCLHYLQTS
jgi:hypothetical protein